MLKAFRLPLISDVNNSGHKLCPTFHGGLGNSMCQFASVLGIAMSKNMNIIVNCKSEINLVFKLNVDLRLNKGNNKITELRTILQRESQNS
jgi:hypothetical protein